jgi:hypothetical protein
MQTGARPGARNNQERDSLYLENIDREKLTGPIDEGAGYSVLRLSMTPRIRNVGGGVMSGPPSQSLSVLLNRALAGWQSSENVNVMLAVSEIPPAVR